MSNRMNILKELPKHMHSQILHARYFATSRSARTVLVLLNNFEFHELTSNGALLHTINLSKTVLKKTESLDIPLFEMEENCTPSSSCDDVRGFSQKPVHNEPQVTFGKFILRGFKYVKIFVLIKCLDKLVILLRTEDGFELQQEFEDVKTFRIDDRDYSHQPKLRIFFCGSDETDDDGHVVVFGDVQAETTSMKRNDRGCGLVDSIHNLHRQIKTAKSELMVHQVLTKKAFLELKSSAQFGCNRVRSFDLSEKNILDKRGDVWMRTTAFDTCLIGIPVVNNSSRSFTIVQNIRVVIGGDFEDLEYSYSVAEVTSTTTEENVEEFIENTTSFDLKENFSFLRKPTLPPETLGVVMIKINLLSFLAAFTDEFSCFLLYDVTDSNDSVHTQQVFIKNVKIPSDFTCNPRYQIDFSEDKLCQDMFAVAATGCSASLQLHHEVSNSKFHDALTEFLETKLNFEQVRLVFYNRDRTSFWHGTLVKLQPPTEETSSIRLKVCTDIESKIVTFAKMLHENFKENFRVEYNALPALDNMNVNLVCLKDALRNEAEAILKSDCATRDADLLRLQLETNLIVQHLN